MPRQIRSGSQRSGNSRPCRCARLNVLSICHGRPKNLVCKSFRNPKRAAVQVRLAGTRQAPNACSRVHRESCPPLTRGQVGWGSRSDEVGLPAAGSRHRADVVGRHALGLWSQLMPRTYETNATRACLAVTAGVFLALALVLVVTAVLIRGAFAGDCIAPARKKSVVPGRLSSLHRNGFRAGGSVDSNPHLNTHLVASSRGGTKKLAICSRAGFSGDHGLLGRNQLQVARRCSGCHCEWRAVVRRWGNHRVGGLEIGVQAGRPLLFSQSLKTTQLRGAIAEALREVAALAGASRAR